MDDFARETGCKDGALCAFNIFGATSPGVVKRVFGALRSTLLCLTAVGAVVAVAEFPPVQLPGSVTFGIVELPQAPIADQRRGLEQNWATRLRAGW
eukprot:CAMPEP_0115188456 /NCGR_PEP_ID=MMETSP0270-20121206/11019_1 /TAXON_ID=71861 /ORGANISM="Scrippsiella trochoidea, Strain CCMP3099" /LENGTH=95 /DNA_ID=CAMNT_0002601637 /DNA_START=508 /DNA_END=792 /DNA_ORIENTATION=-